MTSAEQIEIVPNALEHVHGFHRALDSVARERKYLSVFEAFPVEAMTDFILHQNKTGGPAFVALKAGEVIGWCDIRRQALPAFAHRGSVGMGVVAEWRGRGIGLRLLNAAIKDAFHRGLVRVELEVRADNVRAIALYEKIGFVREGVVRNAFSIDGQYFDAIAMAIIQGSH
jgi:RimJ/RimL family protein N-acetyltransferase